MKWNVLVGVLCLTGLGVWAWAAGERPTTAVDAKSCVTEQCHANIKKAKVLHGPVNVNACDACHDLTDAAKHTFKPRRKDSELCAFCHVTKIEGAKVVHKPMKTGECMGCHDPHGGADKNFLKAGSMKDLCKTCHQDVTGGAKHVHGPVAGGACGACHQPHTSQNKNLLVQTGRDLCVNCHREMNEQLKKARVVHEPVKQDCESCHDPHGSDQKMMLKAPPKELCADKCHKPIAKAVTQAKYRHSAVTEKDACVNCHTAHGGELAGLMKSKPVKVCLKCHNKPVKVGDRTVAAVTEITADDLFKHGPVRDGSCGGCHNVHGSDISRLLNKEYAVDFYESYDAKKYALCFECHDKKLVETPITKGLTKFRNGDTNLHFLHVNKVKRGRSCRACHTTHASHFPVHVREAVPYGNWQLPINFKLTKDGGSCAPGCHQELGYGRDKAIPVDGPSDSTEPAAAPSTPAASDSSATDTDEDQKEAKTP